MRDDFDAVVAERFEVLDDVAVPDTWSGVLERVPVADTWSPGALTKDAMTMIDLETRGPTEISRKGPVRVLVAGLVAAAAAAGLVIVATGDDDVVDPAATPTSTVSVPPTTAPQPLFRRVGDQLEPGTYYVDEVEGTPTAPILVAIEAAGWSDFDDVSSFGKMGASPTTDGPEGDVGLITFSRPDRVFLDACHWSDGFYEEWSVTTLDGLAFALSEQGGWVDVTAPSDISIDGYRGITFQRTTPDEFSDCTTGPPRRRIPTQPDRREPAFRSWESASGVGGWLFYEPGQIETVLILDIDGTVVVVNATPFPETATAADHAEFAAVLDSIRIERG